MHVLVWKGDYVSLLPVFSIVDDSHFSTGFANGELKNAPDELHRQSICVSQTELCADGEWTEVDVYGMFPPQFRPNPMEQYILPFRDCQILSLKELVPYLKQLEAPAGMRGQFVLRVQVRVMDMMHGRIKYFL